MINLILLVFGLGCAILATFSLPTGRVNLGWAAIAFFIGSLLVGKT